MDRPRNRKNGGETLDLNAFRFYARRPHQLPTCLIRPVALVVHWHSFTYFQNLARTNGKFTKQV